MTTPTFVYDGDCAFCTTCAEFVQKRIPTLATVVPWQFADLGALGLTQEQCEEAVQWVGADGVTASGPEAIGLMLRDAGRWWELAGTTLGWSPVRAVAWPAYRWVAEHRHMMPGGTAACALPQAQREALGHTTRSV
ncbi:thiol-disulfide oxidoreductase DCC family protein [Symbioplanes lichenis]|uniref:thiol-disulfide oxidoreductase DCC family protein n=1 Tax=Symbioplanes lichenis TaxID=1629072 RepID=UPI0027392F3C|nr:DCC1-like thiol-disulfide oxidoreductase family protein [Actinoplanes lichenis]